MIETVLDILFGVGIYIALPAVIAFCASYFLKNPKKQIPVAVTVFIISFILEYGSLMYANRHPFLHYYERDVSEEAVSEITDVLTEKYKVTLTSGNKFFIPVGYSILSKDTDSKGYWYRIRLFPFSSDREYFLYDSELY